MINDVGRFFKGGSPARQFEAGQQKEGNFFCKSCSIHSSHVKNIRFTKEMMSLQDRIEKVKSTTISQIKLQKQQLKLYDKLRKTEIIDELHQRAVKLTSTITRKDLMDILSYELHGIQRLPSLWYDYPNYSMKELNLSHCEILPNESLHDVSNHIKNTPYQGFLSHKANNEKKIVIEVIDQSFNGKEARNSSDYRKNLLVVCAFFIERFPGAYYTEMLKTLAEIQDLLYLPEKERSTTKILRFYNTTFLHTLLLKKIENNLKVLTA